MTSQTNSFSVQSSARRRVGARTIRLRIKRRPWLWLGTAMLVMFMMSFAAGLQETMPYRYYSYPVLGLSIAILIGKSGGRLVRFKLGRTTPLIAYAFLCTVVMATLVGGRSLFSAIHIIGWQLAVLLFWYLFINFTGRTFIDGMLFAWLSVILLALLALFVGVYIRYVGEISLPGLTFVHPLRPGTDLPYPQLISWFPSPNYTGAFFLYGFMGCFFCYTLVENKAKKRYFIVFALLLTSGMVMAASRSALIAAGIFLGVLGISLLKLTAKNIRRLFRIVIFISVLLLFVFTTDAGEVILRTARLDKPIITVAPGQIEFGNREGVWSSAWHIFVTGSLLEKIVGIGPDGIVAIARPAHSGWLRVLVEQGILGLVLLLGFVMSVVLQIWLHYRHCEPGSKLRTLFLYQLAYWLAFSALNVGTEIWAKLRIDNFVMFLALAQLGVLNVAALSKKSRGRENASSG